MKAKLLKFICCNVLGGLCVLASATVMAADENRGDLSSADYKFISEAARGGMAEVELGQIAKDRATSPAVKQFAEKMITDHSAANQQLNQLASQKRVTLPAEVTASDKRESDKLMKLSGADFDRAYMKYMVRDHKEDVKEFERGSKKAKDPDIQAWADKTLPTLQQHLRDAESIDASIKNGTMPEIK